MSLVVFNTLTRKKEPFESLEPGLVRMYNCGPTVYSRQHVGNFRAFLFADVLRRWLEYRGYEVQQVMNITDVGHIQGDADEGEDKIERRAREEQLDPWEISRENARLFLDDLRRLDVQPALVYPRATEHIEEMVEIIAGLIEKGYAYQVDGNVYFDVSRFERYGRLSGNKVADLEAGSRVEINEEKRHPADFALWKSDPRHIMKWDTRFGPDGFPGWHIECSAMARAHLGDRIDIHTGGEDNVFPHHECEIAQTECFTGAPFANYWMHTKFLQVDGGKMSKSLGNVYTVDDVEQRGFTARALRFALIRSHYRQPINFTWESMRDASSTLDSLDDLVARLRRAAASQSGAAGAAGAGLELVEQARLTFEQGMDDDLNVSRALPGLFALRAHVLEGRLGAAAAREALALLERIHGVLGVMRLEQVSLEGEIEALIQARQDARAGKDWAEADRLRDELESRGIVLEDTPEGVTWRRKS